MRFLVIEGTNNRLLRTRENLGLRGEEKEETPEDIIVEEEAGEEQDAEERGDDAYV